MEVKGVSEDKVKFRKGMVLVYFVSIYLWVGEGWGSVEEDYQALVTVPHPV